MDDPTSPLPGSFYLAHVMRTTFTHTYCQAFRTHLKLSVNLKVPPLLPTKLLSASAQSGQAGIELNNVAAALVRVAGLSSRLKRYT